VSDLQNSDNNFTIRRGSNKFVVDDIRKGAANIPELSSMVVGVPKTGSGGTIYWNPGSKLGGPNVAGNSGRPSFVGLAHEMFHARDANTGLRHPISDMALLGGHVYSATANEILKSDWSAVYQENQLRNEAGLPLRQLYKRSGVAADNPEMAPYFLQHSPFLYR
jgi:hypothetical protein